MSPVSTSISNWNNSEYWTQKRTQNGNIHSEIFDVHAEKQSMQNFPFNSPQRKLVKVASNTAPACFNTQPFLQKQLMFKDKSSQTEICTLSTKNRKQKIRHAWVLLWLFCYTYCELKSIKFLQTLEASNISLWSLLNLML